MAKTLEEVRAAVESTPGTAMWKADAQVLLDAIDERDRGMNTLAARLAELEAKLENQTSVEGARSLRLQRR